MRLRASLLTIGLAALAVASPARAVTFTVSGTDDSSSGSCDASNVCTNLRYAVTEANRLSGADVIKLNGVTYNVTVGQLAISSDITIAGTSAAATAIRGGGKTRVLDVLTGQKLTVQHATISNGVAEATGDIGGNLRVGAGAQLILDHVRVTGGTSFDGGGVGISGGGSAQISQSLIDANKTVSGGGDEGGGILLAGNASAANGIALALTDSTVTNNSASSGAGVVAGGDTRNKTTLTRTTIASNLAGTNSLGAGLAVADAESFKVTASIIAGNTGDGVAVNCSGTLTSGGGNIDTGKTCGLATSSDRQSTDPALQPPQAGLGETPVLPITALSPAVDLVAIGAAACTGVPTDQRDLARPQGIGCDSGAFEVDQAPDTRLDSGPGPLIKVNTATFTFSSTEPGAGFQCELDTPSGQGAFVGCSSPRTYNGLADGNYTFTVRAIDGAGQVDGSPPSQSFTVDTTPPAAPTITTPASDVVQKATSVTLGGSAEPGSTVQVFDNGTSKASTTAGRLGTWSLTLSGLGEGAHAYTAKATDGAGNTSGASNTRTITVDTTPPGAPTITTPAADTVQNSTSVILGGSAESGATVQVFDGATSKGSTTATGGAWSITITGVSEGAHPYTAKATDAAGNTSGASNTRTITVDTTPPGAPTITTPAADALQNTRTVTLGGTTDSGTSVEVFDNGTSKGQATVTGTTWTITLTNVSDGAHPYTAKAKDAATNTSGASNTRTITIDTAAPNPPTITTPPADALQNSKTITLSGSTVSGTSVEVFDGAASKGGATVTVTSWSITISGVGDGAHVYTAKAKDAAGNTSGASNTRTITIDTLAPTATIDSGPQGPTNVKVPSFGFSASELATFSCRLDGPGVATGTPAACTPGQSFGPLADGDYTLRVQAIDAAGNIGAAATRTFTVDTVPPSDDVLSGPTGVTTQSSPTFTFSSDGTKVECRLDGPGAAVGTYGPCASPAGFSGLAPGDYTFFVRATDAAGNQTETSRSFTVTSVQQSPPVTTAQNPQPVPGKSVVIQPVNGQTLIKKPGSTAFVPVDFTQGIPLGSIVDTRHSKIRLYAIPKAGQPAESALFYGGIFKVTQTGGVTQLQLVEALATCKASKASAAAKKPKTRKLWGDGSGAFRTRGQYSAATVRGTRWLVQDSCGKTLTKVAKGVVSVQDFVRHKTLLLRAPKSYTAVARRR